MLILPKKTSLYFNKPSRITRLTPITTHVNKTEKWKMKQTVGHQRILFLTFDLSTKTICFGNGSNRVTTVAYEIKCHPSKSILLKSLLIKSCILDLIAPFDSNIHFIPHDLIQSTDTPTVKNQITQQNHFLTQTGIVPILNITETAMNSGIKTRLLDIPSLIWLDPKYLTESSAK